LISGIVFLVCSLLYDQLKHGKLRPFAAGHVFVFLMLLLTAYSQFSITPRMTYLRFVMQLNSPDVPGSQRAEFDRLHAWSTRLEGGVLFLGLAAAFLTSRRFGSE
jgi:uncharacterized membrane protein